MECLRDCRMKKNSNTFTDDDPLCSAVVDIECSPAAPCTDLKFSDIDVAVPSDQLPEYGCANVASIAGLAGCGW